jgi:hypothetical protein
VFYENYSNWFDQRDSPFSNDKIELFDAFIPLTFIVVHLL